MQVVISYQIPSGIVLLVGICWKHCQVPNTSVVLYSYEWGFLTECSLE